MSVPVCLATRAASEGPNPSSLLVRVRCRQGSGAPFPTSLVARAAGVLAVRRTNPCEPILVCGRAP